MILNLEQTTPLNRVLLLITAFFGFGLAILLLFEFYAAMTQYDVFLARILVFCAVALVLSLVAYVMTSLFLSIEYRATENEIFKQTRQQFLPSSKATNTQQLDGDGDDTEQRILELYDEMTACNSLSMNQICLEIYGKKGGTYNDKVRQVLRSNDRI